MINDPEISAGREPGRRDRAGTAGRRPLHASTSRLGALLLSLGIAALLAACGTPTPPDDDPDPAEVIVRDAAVILDATARSALLEVRDDGTLVFATVAAGAGGAILPLSLPAWEPGNVVVSEPAPAAPDGLLRLVTAVEHEENRVLLSTEQAELGDVLQRGSLSEEFELSLDDLENVDFATEGFWLAESGDMAWLAEHAYGFDESDVFTSQAGWVNVNFNFVIIDTDGNLSTTADQVRGVGEISFKPGFKIDLDLDCGPFCLWDNDIDFLVRVSLDETARLAITSGSGVVGYNLKKTVPIGTFTFGTYTFFIGPVPVVIRPRVVLELRFDGSIGMSISYEIRQTLSLVAGAIYDDGWENISSVDTNFSVGPVKADEAFTAVFRAKGTAAARGELLFYGIVGPTLEFAGYALFDVRYPRDPIWKLDAGLEMNLGITIDVLGFKRHYYTNLWDDSVEIARAPNTAPTVSFLGQPQMDWAYHPAGLLLRAHAVDPEDGFDCCTVSFRSSSALDGVGGQLGSLSGQWPELPVQFTSLGERTITVTATDSKGATGTATQVINVINEPPTVGITAPFNGQEFFQGQPLTLRGSGYDIKHDDWQVPCPDLHWSSSVPGDPEVSGCNVPVSFGGAVGARTLTLTTTDMFGATATTTVTVHVTEAPDNLPPVVSITSPAHGLRIGPNTVVSLAGFATDPELGDVTNLVWDVLNGYNPATGTGAMLYPVMTGAGGEWAPSDSIPYGGPGCVGINDILRLRLRADDLDGNTGSDFIVLYVDQFC